MASTSEGVNLPRWGLKQHCIFKIKARTVRVNLPRWGLKQSLRGFYMGNTEQCKFTPLGFETLKSSFERGAHDCVNLPRWGLKSVNSAIVTNEAKV